MTPYRDPLDGPTMIDFDYNLSILILRYFVNGVMHRDNGPSYIEMKNGVILYELYRKQGKLHRKNGPAIINKIIDSVEWWIEGNRLSKDKEMLLNIWYSNQLHPTHIEQNNNES